MGLLLLECRPIGWMKEKPTQVEYKILPYTYFFYTPLYVESVTQMKSLYCNFMQH